MTRIIAAQDARPGDMPAHCSYKITEVTQTHEGVKITLADGFSFTRRAWEDFVVTNR